MSNVTLTLGGRTFTVACADGEEDHVAGLGRMIDEKLSAMGDMSSQSESRMLLFAALLLADEVHDAQSRPQPGAPASAANGTADAGRLDAIASRLERLAEQLERAEA